MRDCRRLLGCVLTFTLFLIVIPCAAQINNEQVVYSIQTKDGNGYTGYVVSSDSLKLLFRDKKLGEIAITKREISKMAPLDAKQLKKGKYWAGNPQSTRYFFSPDGYGLSKGEGYYQNLWVLVNSFAIGLNDYFSLGGGVVPLFLFAGAPTPVWLNAKMSIPVVRDKVNLGAGILSGTVFGVEKSGFGIFYGISTFGSRDRNISLGLGYGFSGSSISNAPMINVNAMYRVGANSYLLTENYFFPDGSNTSLMMMVGARQIIREAGLDYGLVFPAGSGINSGIAIPWLGITIPFGKRH